MPWYTPVTVIEFGVKLPPLGSWNTCPDPARVITPAEGPVGPLAPVIQTAGVSVEVPLL